MGVRRTDKEFKTQVDSALSSLAPQIETIWPSTGSPLRGSRRLIDRWAVAGRPKPIHESMGEIKGWASDGRRARAVPRRPRRA